jgi:hypothetical protein
MLCLINVCNAAEIYYTKPGYIATTTESLLDTVIYLVKSGDQQAFLQLLWQNPGVFSLDGGLRVYLEDITWDNKVKIRAEGSVRPMWTLKAAIYD